MNTGTQTARLAGTSVLITRAEHQSAEFADLVRREGGTPVLFPTISIEPPESWDACDRSIEGLYMYNGLIFTSPNGVEFFFKRLAERGEEAPALAKKMICVVGEKTKEHLATHGLAPLVMPERFTSADLAAALEQEDVRGKTFLFPRGNLGKDILQDNLRLLGATVDPVIVYRTVPPRREEVEIPRQRLLAGEIDVITFTSPSTFSNFAALFTPEELKGIFNKAAVAVIGPVTERAVAGAGIEADIVADQSTVSGLVEAIAAHLAKRS